MLRERYGIKDGNALTSRKGRAEIRNTRFFL